MSEHGTNELTSPNIGCPAKWWFVALSATEIVIVFSPLISIVVGTFFHTIRWFVPTSITPLKNIPVTLFGDDIIFGGEVGLKF
jgi:hypothetical protein